MADTKQEKTEKSRLVLFKDFITFHLSFKGAIPYSEFWGIVLFGYLLFYILSNFPGTTFRIIGWFCYFYVVLGACQRRCRDLHIKGTPIILIVSAFYITTALTSYIDVSIVECIPQISNSTYLYGIVPAYVCALLALVFIPGKKEPDLTLTSPLLKYPNIYFIVCCALYLIAKYFMPRFCI